MRRAATIFWLGIKELRSVLTDTVLIGLVLYSFSLAILAPARSGSQEVRNASVAIVDEDRSPLSRRIAGAFLPPLFRPPVPLAARDVAPAMDAGRYTLVLDVPPHFARDLLARRHPVLKLEVDATAMVQAGLGATYAQQILADEIARYLTRGRAAAPAPVTLVSRIAYNPNVETAWFTSVMGILNSVTMLAIILAGAAIVRERERGTLDHLMVMPVTPLEIALAKIWANGAVILTAVGLSLVVIVRGLLRVPLAGSLPLFLFGTAIYLFFATAVGLYLGTVARSMPQLGLLYLLIYLPLAMLSGSNTPLESMPPWLSAALQASPTVHFVAFAQAVLYRSAGPDVVWPRLVIIAGIGSLVLILSLLRFRHMAKAETGG
ncbi:ABC transporter permease [Methylobacterium sp. SyP6R]|uniref:ABC transporter permease n=1 Tax=Methylobacterium sp. SyP6R TaxID=2718876 RepID=UPI001F2D1DA4|nr:ABC transporter permease [Methylobacterium sp. SyP6R]MCF4129563.1 ABC transporter permease [Methylobacterium sp. SyP6R]